MCHNGHQWHMPYMTDIVHMKGVFMWSVPVDLSMFILNCRKNVLRLTTTTDVFGTVTRH